LQLKSPAFATKSAISGCEQSQQGITYSITSSAQPSNVIGQVRPSVSAVGLMSVASVIVGCRRYRRLGDTLARLVRNCPSIESESGCSLPRNTGRTTWDRKRQVPSSPRTHSLIISAIRHGEGARCTGGGPFARKQAECRHKTCVAVVRREDRQVADKMPGGRRPAPSAPSIEGADLVVPREPVLADLRPLRA
jgi:hypothetical protein